MLKWSFFFSKKLSEDLVFQFFFKKGFDNDQGCALRKISGSPSGSQAFYLSHPDLKVGRPNKNFILSERKNFKTILSSGTNRNPRRLSRLK